MQYDKYCWSEESEESEESTVPLQPYHENRLLWMEWYTVSNAADNIKAAYLCWHCIDDLEQKEVSIQSSDDYVVWYIVNQFE